MGLTRRDFIRGSVASVPATMAMEMLAGPRWLFAQSADPGSGGSADFTSDIDVLNYALTLEYLESAFYKQGNDKNLLSGKEKEYLKKVGADEDAHVSAIKATVTKLGGTPVTAPGVDFKDSFKDRKSFLTTAHVFENLGVSAYLGAAGFIENKEVLQAAAGIFGVEARHAAVIGNLLELEAEGGVYMGAQETAKTKSEVLAAAGPFIKA
ncbi:MAG: ferritin-like domain-containing protein [Actinomycetota bacterium]